MNIIVAISQIISFPAKLSNVLKLMFICTYSLKFYFYFLRKWPNNVVVYGLSPKKPLEEAVKLSTIKEQNLFVVCEKHASHASIRRQNALITFDTDVIAGIVSRKNQHVVRLGAH